MATRLGGVKRGNQWDVIEFGQGDRRMCDQPVVCVHDVRLPALTHSWLVQRHPGTDHRVTHREGPREHVLAEDEVCRVLGHCDDQYAFGDVRDRRVRRRIGAGGAARENHDFVAYSRKLGGEMVDVSAEAADNDRWVLPRDDENLHDALPFTSSVSGRRRASSPGTIRRRDSSLRPVARRRHRGRKRALRRFPWSRGRACVRVRGRTPRPNPCSP